MDDERTIFSHLTEDGRARMVDVGLKPVLNRRAVAEGFVRCGSKTVAALRDRSVPKGDVFAVARVAGILAAKRTDALIPMCHSLPLDGVSVELEVTEEGVRIQATAMVCARTGVEMEALTAVTVAALTVYDMCKSVDPAMEITGVRLLEKTKS
jgi:cyclic pyranopterin phosphate synthase